MGVVYAARDPKLRRTVALKMLRPGGAGHETQAKMHERLLREARAMARLSHPNVLPVHDVGELGGNVFVAMELVDGGTLRTWCCCTRGRPHPPRLQARQSTSERRRSTGVQSP